MYVPVSRPSIGEDEKRLVHEALEKGEISGTYGASIGEFEEKFAEYCGCRYGVATSSGTTALHLALATLGIGKGDEVLVSTFTNMATFFAVLYQGAKPIPIDIEPDTWNLNPSLLEEKITDRTKAILVVHIYGHPVDMDPVLEVARKHNLLVIEDAAEAHGAEYKGKRVGSLGDIACFSFYANKVITTGEGGMVVTDNEEYALRARALVSLAYGKKEKFMHEAVGFNYRLSNVQAALGVAQMKRIDEFIDKRRTLADFYGKELSDIEELQLPVEKSYARNVYWMYHVVLRGALEGKRDRVMRALAKEGVETREAFVPANMQKVFLEKVFVKEGDCPVANEISRNGLYLPSGANLSEKERQYVVDRVVKVVRELRA